jgi:hypothetical protein
MAEKENTPRVAIEGSMENSTVSVTQIGWRFWLGWVVVSVISAILGFGLAKALNLQESSMMLGAVFGGTVGVAQSLFLRMQVSGYRLWALASAIGWAVGFWVYQEAMLPFLFDVGTTLGLPYAVIQFLLVGSMAGVAQWLLLRRWRQRAGWWIVASSIGWSVGLTWIGLSPDSLFSFIGLVAWGAVTGGALLWILRQPAQTEKSRGEIGIWGLCLEWVVATAIGAAVGGALASVGDFGPSLSLNWSRGDVAGDIGILLGLAGVFALTVGLTQWWVLRERLPNAAWWIFASLPLVIVGQLDPIQPGVVVRGSGVGVAQFLVLRQSVSWAGVWIPSCVVGWTIGLAAGKATVEGMGVAVGNTVFGAVVGVITGPVLVWLLRQIPDRELTSLWNAASTLTFAEAETKHEKDHIVAPFDDETHDASIRSSSE